MLKVIPRNGLGGGVGAGAAVDQVLPQGFTREEIAEGRVLRRGAALEEHLADTCLAERFGQVP